MTHRRARLISRPWFGPLVLAICFAGMAAYGWRRGPDVLIDYGRELYTPWRLSLGEALYRDATAIYGPLAPMLNGWIFSLFGPSIDALRAAGLVAAGLVLSCLYLFFRDAADRVTALACGLAFLFFFAFGQFAALGNYVWTTPYSYDVVYGTALAVFETFFLARWLKRGDPFLLWLAGLCLGLAFLTKPEIFAAATAVCAATGLAFVLRGKAVGERPGPAGTGRPFPGAGPAVGGFVLSALAPLFVFFLFWRDGGSFADWLDWLSFPYRAILMGKAGSLEFYKDAFGLLHPCENLLLMAGDLAGLALLILAAALWSRPRPWSAKNRALALAGLAALAASALFKDSFPWILGWRPFTPAALGLCCWLYLQLRRKDRHGRKLEPMFLFSVLATALLWKIFLYPVYSYYGFTLAMPAGLLTVWFCFFLAPRRLTGSPRHARRLRVFMAGLLAIDLLFAMVATVHYVENKTFALGQGGDAMATYPEFFHGASSGRGAAMAVAAIERFTPPDASLLVIPEGILFNYLTRRPSPVRYYNYLPPELAYFGLDRTLADLKDARPGFILLTPRQVAEYGLDITGEYGRFTLAVARWLRDDYQLAWSLPQDDAAPGASYSLFKRKTAP